MKMKMKMTMKMKMKTDAFLSFYVYSCGHEDMLEWLQRLAIEQ